MLSGMDSLKTERTNDDGTVRKGMRATLKCADHIINNCVQTGMEAARRTAAPGTSQMVVHRILEVLQQVVTHYKMRAREDLLIKSLKAPGVSINLLYDSTISTISTSRQYSN